LTGNTLDVNAGRALVDAEEVLATNGVLQSANNTTIVQRSERGDRRIKEVAATAKEYRDDFVGELWVPPCSSSPQ
jgi:hypothetical protein